MLGWSRAEQSRAFRNTLDTNESRKGLKHVSESTEAWIINHARNIMLANARVHDLPYLQRSYKTSWWDAYAWAQEKRIGKKRKRDARAPGQLPWRQRQRRRRMQRASAGCSPPWWLHVENPSPLFHPGAPCTSWTVSDLARMIGRVGHTHPRITPRAWVMPSWCQNFVITRKDYRANLTNQTPSLWVFC